MATMRFYNIIETGIPTNASPDGMYLLKGTAGIMTAIYVKSGNDIAQLSGVPINRFLTQAEYDALSDEERNNPAYIYNIEI